MSNLTPAVPDVHNFPFYCLRNISAPEDKDNNRTIYVGKAPASSFLNLSDHENVRDYLVDAPGRRTKRPTAVHLAMRDTLQNTPDSFSVLNTGITLVAQRVEIDDKKRVAYLTKASIINGSQTQGELKRFLEEQADADNVDALPKIHVAYEIIQTTDDKLIADISISRNFMNDVMNVSIAGRRGQLDELSTEFNKQTGDNLQKSETDLSKVSTEKLLQVITALVPDELWPREGERDNPNKAYAYNAKAVCLKEFQRLWDKAHSSETTEETKKAKRLYEFYLQICGEAWRLYNDWKKHNGFKGTGLRCLKRDKKGNILDVPDGIVFPILAALAVFAEERNGKWTISPPSSFSDDALVKVAVQTYMGVANSDPSKMGKSAACYTQLREIAVIYRKLSPQQ